MLLAGTNLTTKLMQNTTLFRTEMTKAGFNVIVRPSSKYMFKVSSKDTRTTAVDFIIVYLLLTVTT